MRKGLNRFIFGVISIGLCIFILWGLSPQFPCIKDKQRQSNVITSNIVPLLTDVPNSTIFRYGAKDTQNRGLDCLNIIEFDTQLYYGVHHTWNGTSFSVHLVFSTDLDTWNYISTLAFEASMPALRFRPVQGDFFLVHEQWQNPNCGGPCLIKIQYFSNLSTLINAQPQVIFQMNSSFSLYEGTPSIYFISEDCTQIQLGFHFLNSEGRDQVANGTLSNLFSSYPNWEAEEWTWYNQRLICLGNQGNIGGRDYGFIANQLVSIQEAQLIKDNWSTWQIWLYFWAEDCFIPLSIQTHQNSQSFCNPHFAIVHDPRNSSRLGVFTSYFIPYEGAGSGESGELFLFTPLP